MRMGAAVLSECGRYRYRLDRSWDRDDHGLGTVTWVMLNPSTADASVDDPTIRRCIGFSKLWGYNALTVVNLFAWRATDPDELLVANDPVGPDNEAHLIEATCGCDLAVAAWGASWPRPMHAQAERVGRELAAHADKEWAVRCLGVTATGQPRHPLYVRGDTALQVWRSPS